MSIALAAVLMKAPHALAKAFQKQDYAAALQLARYLDEPLRYKVICTAHIKNQDTEQLDAYLASEEGQRRKQDLLFYQAYADYAAKRDAGWFLKVNGAHPKENALKQQILYRAQCFSQAAALTTPQLQQTPVFEQVVNNLAIAVRAGGDYKSQVVFENFEYFYNSSLHCMQQCYFERAEAFLKRALEEASTDPEAASQKDMEHLRVLEIILAKYWKNYDSDYMLDYFYSADCKSLLEIFKVLTIVNFSPCARFVGDIRAYLQQLQNDLNAIRLRCDATVYQQMDGVCDMVADLLAYKKAQKTVFNCNQMLQRCREFASRTALFGQSLAKKARKLSAYELYEEALAFALRQTYRPLRYYYSAEYQRCFSRFYQAFYNYPVCAQLGEFPECGLLYVQDFTYTVVSVASRDASSLKPAEIAGIQASVARQKTEPKQMPLKWQKKKRRGANAGKHQGADVKSREEVSKVKVQTSYVKNRKGRKK